MTLRAVEHGGDFVAHGLGGRSDLPVAPWLATYAGAAVVVISFFAATVLWSRPRWEGRGGEISLATFQGVVDSPPVRLLCRAVGVLFLAVFLTVAWTGPDDLGLTNPAPTWFYVWFWVGLVPLSLLCGPIWKHVNPLRPMAAGLAWLGRVRPLRLPESIGFTPAVIALLAFLWLELVYDHSASPRVIAGFVAAYAVVHVVAGALFGSVWFERGDGFEVFSTMLGRAAPFARNADGSLVLRSPLRGIASTPSQPNLTPVVVVVLGSTVFDGLSRSGWWSDLVDGVARAEYLALGTAGLFGAIAAVGATFGGSMLLTRRFAQEGSSRSAPSSLFAPSLIPIVVGYTVAHYFSFALFQGQQGYLLANDPLGRGWDLFGLAGASIDYRLLSTTQIAFVQVGAIVVGHVLAVFSAHDRSLKMFRAEEGTRGQYPLLVVMVAYTCCGIVLLSGG